MRFDLFWYGSIDICGSSIYMYAVCFIFVPGGGGGAYGTDGDARRKFWETIWAWLKLFVTPKGEQSGRGLSKF